MLSPALREFRLFPFFIGSVPVVSLSNIGVVSSAAIIPFMAVPKRACLVDSKFLIHPPAWEFAANSRETIDSLQCKILELTRYKEHYAEILDRLTSDIDGHKFSEYLSGESVFLSAFLALQVGLCNCNTKIS